MYEGGKFDAGWGGGPVGLWVGLGMRVGGV